MQLQNSMIVGIVFVTVKSTIPFSSHYLHPINIRVVSASWWSKKRLLPVSSVAMAAMSSSESAKSKMSMFCCIRSMWVDLGMITTPR